MEKKIILTMLPSKDIDIVINEQKRITIIKDQRVIKADEIYNLLAYSRGDVYSVESINPEGKDAPVLQFFLELFQDIINRLNKMSETVEDDGDNGSAGGDQLISDSASTYNEEKDELPF